MAVYNGKDGIIKVGSPAAGVAEVMSFTVNFNMETIDASSMDSTYRKKLAGLCSWDGSLEVRWDDTDTDGQEALLSALHDSQAKIAVELYPEGDAAGAYKISGDVFITNTSQTQSYDNTTVTRTFTFEGESTPTIGTVPSP